MLYPLFFRAVLEGKPCCLSIGSPGCLRGWVGTPHEYALWINMPLGKFSYLFQLISSWPHNWKGQKLQTVPCNRMLKSFHLTLSYGSDSQSNSKAFHSGSYAREKFKRNYLPTGIFCLNSIFHPNLFVVTILFLPALLLWFCFCFFFKWVLAKCFQQCSSWHLASFGGSPSTVVF